MQILSYTDHSRFESPEIFVKGYKDKVVNSEGKEFYDLTSGLWNVNYGYNSELYHGIISEQVSQLHFYPNHFWSSTDISEKAAEKLCSHFDMAAAYFTNGGSDAIFAAIELCRHCTSKKNVIAYDKGFHGYNKEIFYTNDLVDSIDDQTLAVIIEPIMTTNGVLSFDYELLYNLELLRRQYRFYIIFDETVTGLGRVDIDYSIKPDIIICSKGLTNGLFPIGATLVNDEIAFQVKKKPKVFNFGITSSGHPIGCALTLRSLELYEKYKDDRINLREKFNMLLDNENIPYDNYGLIYGIKVNDGRIARNKLKSAGYLTRNKDNTLIVLPMFNIDINNYLNFVSTLGIFLNEIS